MFRFLRRNKSQPAAPKSRVTEIQAPLTLQTSDGTLKIEFIPEIVGQIRQMISRIESRDLLVKRMGYLAAVREEGVTYLSLATGTTMANDLNADVCVVDFNWWWPSPVSQIGYEGLGSVLMGQRELNDVLVTTNHPNLVLLPSGFLPIEERPSAARSDRLSRVLSELDERFDHLILDIPAILAVSEAVPLAVHADACCLVVHQGVTSSNNVRRALDEVQHIDMLGVVMNQVKTHIPKGILQILPSE
ncbi:MAG: hypothetical protein QNJ45_04150 [Ardenticatenaceae bacterium]|nr:hypothetical protein [Ardenticatenaceae bacterium]